VGELDDLDRAREVLNRTRLSMTFAVSNSTGVGRQPIAAVRPGH
jgi:hypothetical protein